MKKLTPYEEQVLQRLDAITEAITLLILLNENFDDKGKIEETLGYKLIAS